MRRRFMNRWLVPVLLIALTGGLRPASAQTATRNARVPTPIVWKPGDPLSHRWPAVITRSAIVVVAGVPSFGRRFVWGIADSTTVAFVYDVDAGDAALLIGFLADEAPTVSGDPADPGLTKRLWGILGVSPKAPPHPPDPPIDPQGVAAAVLRAAVT